MRFIRILISVICLLAAASAAEIKIKVLDPQSAVVAGAQVVLIPQGSTTPAAVATTSAEGLAVFHGAASSPYRVQVLAPGFATETTNLSPGAEVTVRLRLAAAAETVVVTATRSPIPTEEAGADVESLNGGQLQTMQPIAADDAHTLSSRRRRGHGGTARRAVLAVRARRRFPLQQSHRGWRNRQ